MNKIIWLTGQSGAGKTTLAYGIAKELDYIVLDGDEMRDSISLGAGFSREDRREHNLKISRLAKILSEQTNVIVSVIAPMEEVRKDITEICNPNWIYLKRDIPDREGHFYEEPKGYKTIDIVKGTYEENLELLMEHITPVIDIEKNLGADI